MLPVTFRRRYIGSHAGERWRWGVSFKNTLMEIRMTTVPSAVAAPAAQMSEFEEKTYRKVVRRLLPVLLLCYVVAYLDRVNVGFAKLQMLDDLGLSDTMYAIGASVFFWGYFIFEIPSNVFLHRYGARFWIARIMFTWGL